MEKKLKRETNNFIFKYQKEDVDEKLTALLGNDFKKYREDFYRAENYPKTGFIPAFPLTLYVEFVNRCNYNCIMCYKKHHQEPIAELDLSIFQKIMKEAKENNLPSINLGMGAEMFLYKDIKKAIEMVKDAGIKDIFFSTNASLLNDELIELIVKNKITRIKISLDAATVGTYKKIRRDSDLEKVEKNIEKIIECKKKYGSILPLIRLSFVVLDQNKGETRQFIEKWKDKVDYIDFQRCIDFAYVDQPATISPKTLEKSFCPGPFYSLSIWADGTVTPFCSFYDLKLPMGNVYKQSLKKIWNGDNIKKIRQQIISKNFNPACQKCLYFEDNTFIENIPNQA